MAFISNGTTKISFAEYQDVVDMDQRLFEANEGLTDDVVESALIRSTDRILTLVRATDWWRSYFLDQIELLCCYQVFGFGLLSIHMLEY